MSYGNNITRSCELAFQAYARGIGYTLIQPENILAGLDDEDRVPTPRLVFVCQDAQLDGPQDDAVWDCRLEIQYVSNADKPGNGKQAHYNAAAELFSQFHVGRYALPDAINAAAAANNPPLPFQLQDIQLEGQSTTIEGRTWVSTLTVRAICCGCAVD